MEDIVLQTSEDLPLRDVVFNTLRDGILMGKLQPGDRLMEVHLAKKLGVSRTPVRDAIHMLEVEGLAKTYPRRGAVVASMTEKDLEDVLEIREALDALAVTCALHRMGAAELAELKKAMEDFEAEVKGGDVKGIVSADEMFHAVIYDSTDNPK